jgi:hypothetical protein
MNTIMNKRLIPILLVTMVCLVLACKAKRCASFEGQDGEHKIKYDRHGRVKK